MMKARSKSKLTLWVADDIKEFGHAWSRQHKGSLSQLFTDFLRRLKQSETPSDEIPPIIQNMTGVLQGSRKTGESYPQHLKKKYLLRHSINS